MTTTPALRIQAPRGKTTAVALVLHGGRQASMAPTRPHHLPVLRMLPFATSLQQAGTEAGLAVARLRYTVRGWNGAARSPIADASWALDTLTRRFPAVPIALVGHSMGGRTALYVAGHEGVRVVVALAPWIEADDPVHQLAHRRVLIAHGARDRVTAPRASAGYAQRATAVAESVSFVDVSDEHHAMMRRPRLWHDLTTGFVLGVLYGQPPRMARHDTRAVLIEALAGQASLVV